MLYSELVCCIAILTTLASSHVLNYDSVTVCDGVAKEIQCPIGENIHVLQGFYGKWRNHDCKGEKIDPDNLPTCRQERSQTSGIVRDLCHGKNTCSLLADKSVYGQPCPDNKAYLYMTFFCMKNGQKLMHRKTEDNEEVVTVPSHGYIIREEKVHLEEDRRMKQRQDAKRQQLVKLKNPNLLNPNPQPENGTRKSGLHEDKKISGLKMTVKESAPIFSSVEEALKVENSLERNAKKKENVGEKLKQSNNKQQEKVLAQQKSMIINYFLKTGTPAKKMNLTTNEKSEDGAKKSSIQNEIHRTNKPVIKETSADFIVSPIKLDAIPKQPIKLDAIPKQPIKLDDIPKQPNKLDAIPKQDVEEGALDEENPTTDEKKAKKNQDKPNISLSQMRAVTICNGESKMIACLPEEGIRIQDAFYGKRSGEDCHGKMPYRDDAPTCSALDAQTNIDESCNDKQSCLLKADENVYGKKLCPHVNKYLQLKYACVPLSESGVKKDKVTNAMVNLQLHESEEDEAVIRTLQELARTNSTEVLCNGEKKTITCLRNPGIAIHSAFFGKPAGMDCRGELNYRDDIPECSNPRVLETVKMLCENQKSCEMASESSLYGKDECPGVNKYLEVTWAC